MSETIKNIKKVFQTQCWRLIWGCVEGGGMPIEKFKKFTIGTKFSGQSLVMLVMRSQTQPIKHPSHIKVPLSFEKTLSYLFYTFTFRRSTWSYRYEWIDLRCVYTLCSIGWLCSHDGNDIQINCSINVINCSINVINFAGVLHFSEIRIREIHSSPHFCPVCIDIVSWKELSRKIGNMPPNLPQK